MHNQSIRFSGILFIIVVIWISVCWLSGCGTSNNSASTASTAGTYNHSVYMAVSNDGITWTNTGNVLFEHASVPGACYLGGLVYLYFVDSESRTAEQLSVAISSDGGYSFGARQAVSISGSNTTYPVDPNPIVDGELIRLTYLANFQSSGPSKIVTATSADGINFTEEAVLATATDNNYFDPDLFYHQGAWNMFINDDSGGLIRFISDGTVTGNYAQVTTFNFTAGSISSTVTINSQVLTYYAGLSGMSVALFDGDTLSVLTTNIISNQGFGTGPIADPTVVAIGANDYRMYFKFQAL